MIKNIIIVYVTYLIVVYNKFSGVIRLIKFFMKNSKMCFSCLKSVHNNKIKQKLVRFKRKRIKAE